MPSLQSGCRCRNSCGAGAGMAGSAQRPEPRVRPPPLAAGSLVRVVAPAGPVDRLAAGLEVLTSWGLRIELGEHVLARDDTLPYLAWADVLRASNFTAAWTNPEVATVWAARGGYGSQRMLDSIDCPPDPGGGTEAPDRLLRPDRPARPARSPARPGDHPRARGCVGGSAARRRDGRVAAAAAAAAAGTGRGPCLRPDLGARIGRRPGVGWQPQRAGHSGPAGWTAYAGSWSATSDRGQR